MSYFAHKQLENQKLTQFFIFHFLFLREKLKNEKLNFRAIFKFFISGTLHQIIHEVPITIVSLL